jgi:hypothetical protein
MPNRSSETDTALAPDARAAAEYERDFYSWALEQAELIREGRWTAVDRENVAEEIESLGREQFNKLESAIRILLIHMLKWDNQPERRSRSWALSIKEQRLQLANVLVDNPGLKPRLMEAVERAYQRGRLQAARETDVDEARFPARCPYAWEEISDRDFSQP